MGVEKFEKESSIEHVTKSIRDMRIFLDQKVQSNEEKFEIQHDPGNVIDLDEDELSLYEETIIKDFLMKS